jgi:STE24 endopeptidase
VKGYTLSPEQERKAINFNRARTRQYFVGFFYGLVIYVLILHWRLGPKYRNVAERMSPGRFRQAILYAPMVLLTVGVLNLPRSIYGHWLVRKYGLSIQGWGSWALDWLKLKLVVALFSVFVVWVLFSIIRESPRRWWFYFWLASLPIIVVVLFVEPVLIEPLFYKFEPLALHQPQLVEEIEKVTTRAGFLIPRDRMFEMKASEKLNAVDAYVTGIGASKRVVVWDTTLAKMSVPQTLFVFGHEMGHYVLNHIPKGMAFAAGQILVFLLLGSRVLKWALHRWGTQWAIRDPADWASLPLLLLLVSVANFVSTPIDCSFSRHLEHEADRYGLEVIHGIVPDSSEVAAQSFQILGEIDLAEPNPSEFVKFWFYTHPPINDRILFARTYNPWSKGQARTAPDRYPGEPQSWIEKFVEQQEIPGLAIGVRTARF